MARVQVDSPPRVRQGRPVWTSRHRWQLQVRRTGEAACLQPTHRSGRLVPSLVIPGGAPTSSDTTEVELILSLQPRWVAWTPVPILRFQCTLQHPSTSAEISVWSGLSLHRKPPSTYRILLATPSYIQLITCADLSSISKAHAVLVWSVEQSGSALGDRLACFRLLPSDAATPGAVTVITARDAHSFHHICHTLRSVSFDEDVESRAQLPAFGQVVASKPSCSNDWISSNRDRRSHPSTVARTDRPLDKENTFLVPS